MPHRSALYNLIHRLGHLSVVVRLGLSLALAVAVWAFTPAGWGQLGRLVAAWDAYAAGALFLIGAGIFTADAAHIRRVAVAEDTSRVLAFVFVLVAALASLLAVLALLHTMQTLHRTALVRHVALSIAAVIEAWFLVHTVFTLRYAHQYYDDCGPGGTDARGIDFPGNDLEPDYLDFAYFAFTIGMAAQTADVAISGRAPRRTALLHSLISFSFNTAIVALSISAVGGLL